MNDLCEKSVLNTIKVAVTSLNGRLVDIHFGKADRFLIYEVGPWGGKLVETRVVLAAHPEQDQMLRIEDRVTRIADCQALVTGKAGPHPQALLDKLGILSVEYSFTIEKGLRYAFHEWEKQASKSTLHA